MYSGGARPQGASRQLDFGGGKYETRENNMMRDGAALLLLMALPLVATACDDSAVSEVDAVTSLAAAGEGTGLAGTWVLNVEASEFPRWRHGNGEGPPEGRRGHRGGGPDDGGAPGMHHRRGQDPGGELVIALDESTLTFTHENGRTRSFYTDGRTETHEMRRGDGEVEVSASLDDGVLVISSVRSDGATMTRTLQVSADGQQLTVTHAMANPARGHSGVVRVVFDRAQ